MSKLFTTSVGWSLRHPRQNLRALDAALAAGDRPPLPVWIWLTGIAVGGSCLYGASLSLALPAWRPERGALWLALSAGLGWCVFGPTLVLVSRRNAFVLAHACLVTMAYGEAVLASGAAVNVVVGVLGGPSGLPAFNIACVAMSNVVMAGALTLQLQAVRVPVWKTLGAWVVALNGSGAVFFRVFARLLGPGTSG